MAYQMIAITRRRRTLPRTLFLALLLVAAFIYHTSTIVEDSVYGIEISPTYLYNNYNPSNIISNPNAKRGLYTFHEQIQKYENVSVDLGLHPSPDKEDINENSEKQEVEVIDDRNLDSSDEENEPQIQIDDDEETPTILTTDGDNSQLSIVGEQQQRPMMHTFFEPDPKGYCCGMLNSGHELLLSSWEKAWQDRGWDTKVLTLEDAMVHPDFETYKEKLKKIGLTEYNQKCFWRWFAMAALPQGGWMSDYDTFPLELDGAQAMELAEKDPAYDTFTSYSNHVPCLIHASQEEWDRILHLMLDTLPEDHGVRATDMQSLIKVGQDIGVEEAGMIWKDETYRTFGYRRNEEDELEINCDDLVGMRVAHLSHQGTKTAWISKLFPEIERELGPMNGRGEAARIFMNDYNVQCLGIKM